MRDLGKMGENLLGLWTGEVGIICNKAIEDKGGWDFLLQMPPQPVPAGTTSLDKIPPTASCLLQVKATDVLDPPDVKLDNWKRFADPALPAFFLVLNFAGGGLPQDAFLVHVGEEWIAEVLKHLWKLPPEEGDKLHKHTMCAAWTDDDRLTPLNGASLKARIEECIGPNLLKYQEQKRHWWERAGYDARARYRMALLTGPDGDNDANEQLANFAIGRLKRLPSTLTAFEEIRFGVAKPVCHDVPQEVVVSLKELEASRVVTTIFSTPSRRASFETKLFSSRSMFPFLKERYDRYRLVCEDFDLIASPKCGRWSISLPGLKSVVPRPLSSLVNLGELTLMHEEAKNSGNAIEIHLKIGDAKISFFTGRPGPRFDYFDADTKRVAEAASDAGLVARTMNIDPEIHVTLDELARWHTHLRRLRALLGTDRKSLLLNGDVDADCPDGNELACSIVEGAFIGKTLVLVAAAVHGHPEFLHEPGSKRKQFVIHQPSVDIVDQLVVEDGSEGSYAAAPFYAKIHAWIEEKRYILLPTSMDGQHPDSA